MRTWLTRGVVAAVAAACGGPAASAPAPAVEYRMQFDDPVALERRLAELGDDGFQCAGVPRPEPPFLPGVVGVVLTRSAACASGVRVSHRVLYHMFPDDLATAMNAAAAEGYRVCGMTAGRFEGRFGYHGFDYVAVMARVEGMQPPPVVYRLLPSTGYASEWRRIDAAGAEGFTMTPAYWKPRPNEGVADLLLLGERRGDAPPALEFDIESGRDPVSLGDRLAKRTRDGYRVHTAWTSSNGLVVMIARPKGGRFTTPADYGVFDAGADAEAPAQRRPGVFRVSSFAVGRLLRWLPFGDGRIGVFDRADGRPAYEGVVMDVPTSSDRFGAPLRLTERAQERLSGGYNRGRLLEWRVRASDARDRMQVEVIVETDQP